MLLEVQYIHRSTEPVRIPLRAPVRAGGLRGQRPSRRGFNRRLPADPAGTPRTRHQHPAYNESRGCPSYSFLSTGERYRVTDLTSILADDIAHNGSMTFARFMAVALYHPTLGYYNGGGQ